MSNVALLVKVQRGVRGVGLRVRADLYIVFQFKFLSDVPMLARVLKGRLSECSMILVG